MFPCPKCDTVVVGDDCPWCGFTRREQDEIAAGFVEYLRTGRYERPQPNPPEPFRKRLASYLDCDESAVMVDDPKRSRMHLRVLGPIGPYIGPKPSQFIRFVLHRIHRLVRLSPPAVRWWGNAIPGRLW